MTKVKFTFDDLWNRLPVDIRNACASCEQDTIWHPEGNVENHIRLVFEYVVKNFNSDPDLLISAIFHDLGKPETKVISKNGKISNIGHEYKCEYYINKFFNLFSDVTTNKEKVIEICKNHMKAHLFKNNKMLKPSKRKAFESLKYFDDIMKFAECDEMGKTI